VCFFWKREQIQPIVLAVPHRVCFTKKTRMFVVKVRANEHTNACQWSVETVFLSSSNCGKIVRLSRNCDHRLGPKFTSTAKLRGCTRWNGAKPTSPSADSPALRNPDLSSYARAARHCSSEKGRCGGWSYRVHHGEPVAHCNARPTMPTKTPNQHY
jgi:hypothetical protein